MQLTFPIAPVIAHLAGLKDLKLVSHSADLTTALRTPPNAAPAAYVLGSSRAQPPQFTGEDSFDQTAAAAVQVVLWVRNYASQRAGIGARNDMDALINQVGERVVGFHTTEEFTPLWFGSGTDEHYDGGWLIHQLTFYSEFSIRV